MNPLNELEQHGQSVWYDNIRRGLISSGELQKLIDEDGLKGVTSNPTIFEKAISGSTDYDEAIRDLVGKKKSIKDIFDAISVKDIQMATDLFRPVYERTEGADGFVSIEVEPSLAHDTEGTVAEAKRLWKLVDRPNLMVKIPATKEGLPAIEQCLSEGVNINITLIFSLERYQQVIDAYRAALEKRAKAGKDLAPVASVASFFVSRIDTAVDKLLQEKIQSSQSAKEKDAFLELIGKVAVANAKVAYQVFQQNFKSAWFEALAKKGARPQRALWASTGTKNPNYSDVLYVEELIGPQTVNTMPPATITAFRDHGKPRASLEEKPAEARETLEKLKKAGIDLARVTAQLEAEGEKSFADSYEKLLQCLAAKKEMIQAGGLEKQSLSLGKYAAAAEAAVEALDAAKAPERLWARDASLWKSDPAAQAAIRNRLGWLDLASAMSEQAARLKSFAADVRKAGFTHAVLLGMGGSSLCPEVLLKTFGVKKGYPDFSVLDTTDPAAVLALEARVNIEKTLFIVSSKSGGTIELQSLFKYFFARVQLVKKERAGENFVAVTDPETALEKLAREKRFRNIFLAQPDVGGRYSALTYFGLVPAALLGVEVGALLDRAERMHSGCASCVAARENPGLRLGASLAALAKAGRDKVTFLMSPEIASFGAWVEQLVAESTGKEGLGLVPVEGEEPGAPESYRGDRVFVHMKLAKDDSLDGKVSALEAAGHPVVRIALNDTLDLAQEFLRWEVATAAAGVVLGINPFDEPNVTESKVNTSKILETFRAAGTLPEEPPLWEGEGVKLWADENTARALGKVSVKSAESLVAAHLGRAADGDYVALMAYVTPDERHQKAMQKLRRGARELTRAAVTVGFGPRFLHSTGQLHKGGPNKGVFLQVVMRDEKDPSVPGEFYGFSTLKNAQALGDFEALKSHDCRVVRIQLENPAETLERVARSLDKVKTPA
jgi:transaldolase / glucose-6-phosphate isomerase